MSLLLRPKGRVDKSKAARRELLRTWAKDPYAWVTGDDIDGTPIYWTKDEGDEENPYKAFPKDWEFQREFAKDLFGPQKIVLADKSRQMMVSTFCCAMGLHHTLFKRGRKFMISKQKEDQSWMLIQDKIVGPYERLPVWFRELFPLEMNKNRLRCPVTDSMILGVGQNAAASEFRGNQASILMIDEAAFQEYFGDMLRAAKPMAARVWAVTTANTGNPGAEKFAQMKGEP